MLPASISVVVFDMDGVLWHSTAAHEAAYRAVLGKAGIAMPDYTTLAGRRTSDVMRELFEGHSGAGACMASTVAELANTKQELATRLLRERPPVSPGCFEVLSALARERKLALASSGSVGSVDLFLEASGTRRLFGAIVSGDEVTAAKPDPALYRLALQRLGTAASVAAVVEDAPAGVRSALDAGVTLVIGLEGTVPAASLRTAGAHRVVSHLRELLD